MMALATFCTAALSGYITGQIYPISVLAGVLFAIIIGLTYAASQATSNPKLAVWARTEIVQLVISACFIIVLISMIDSFCSFTAADIQSLTGVSEIYGDASKPIYDAAEEFLKKAANYAHGALITSRYYLGEINIQEVYSKWTCEPIWCFLSVGGTGSSVSPQAGVTYYSSGFMLMMNSATMAFFSAFMHVFFLKYIGSGLFLFLLPIALITRSMPYLRSFGSIILAVLFVLYVIYPSILAAFYLFVDADINNDLQDEGGVPQESTLRQSASGLTWLTGTGYHGPKTEPDDLVKAAKVAFKAFIVAVFLPTAALLAAAGSAAYVARLMGEEIDLSRLVQMV